MARRVRGRRALILRSVAKPTDAARLLIVLSLCWGLVAIGSTQRRLTAWQTDVTLWEATVATDPGLLRPRVNLGQALIEAGKRDAAKVQWDRAADIERRSEMVQPRFLALQIALTRASLDPIHAGEVLRYFGCWQEAGSWSCPAQ